MYFLVAVLFLHDSTRLLEGSHQLRNVKKLWTFSVGGGGGGLY